MIFFMQHWKIWSIDKAMRILGYSPQDKGGKTYSIREVNDADK